MKKKYTFFQVITTGMILATIFCNQQVLAQLIVNSAPTNPFTVPANVSTMKVEVWGGGGGGGGCNSTLGTSFGSGGGGGAYNFANFNVSPTQTYTITVGGGGTVGSDANGGPGGTTTVSGIGGTVSAAGGAGGARRGGAGGGGAVGFRNGGNGGTATSNGAGGGGGAGNATNGSNGTNTSAGAGGTGSPNTTPYIGGAGGVHRTSNNHGAAGSFPSGGGGGGRQALFNGSKTGGAGGAGQVVLTYCVTPPPTVTSPVNLCQDAASSPLTATGTSLLWYENETGGTGSSTAPTPGTATLGTTSYYVSQTVGGCEGPRAVINVTVNPNSTIELTSGVGSNTQTVCIDNAISNITFSTGGVATSASVTAGALPAGVTGTFEAGVFTIAGTPTASGIYNFTVSATGSCPQSIIGTITVNANSTISLTSAVGTDAQSICALTALTNITYNIGGGGTGASITSGSLPSGVSGTFNSGVFTISGTPTDVGTFNYTITATGPCVDATASGSITVNESSSIDLSSAPGTDAQTVCINNPITDITYNIGGSATGGSISGGALPPGVTGSFNAGVFTITGTPTVSGLFNYTVSADGPCPVTLSGSLLVNANSTIILSSAVGTDAQTLCALTPLTDITYSIGGGGTGATITAGALPPGVTGVFNAGEFTISGTPTTDGIFNYTVTTSGPCINVSLSGTINVDESATIDLTSAAGTDAQTVCIDNPITAITYATGGSATGAAITNGDLPDGVAGSFNAGVFTITGTPTVSGIFNYTVTATGPCPVSVTGSITVLANATLVLSSAPGTDVQTVCINTAITNITYVIGATATSASLTAGALPAGVTGSFNAGVFTISGTPTESGLFNYTVTTSGPCVNPSLSGTITVTPDGTISLSSVPGTDAQVVCVDNAITDITYAIGGSSTGASLSSGTLPAGVTGTFNAGVFTITGTPTASGVFNFTVSATGSPCVNPSLSGSITVNANSTISLTSAPSTATQSVCINTAITNITYAIGGGGTGAGVTGLPAGLTGSFNAGVFTISGSPSAEGIFDYTVTTTGPCINSSLGGTITVIGNATLVLTSGAGTNIQTTCQGSAITDITYAVGGTATGANISGLPAGVTGSLEAGLFTISGTPTGSGVFNYNLTTTGPCVNPILTGTITVNALPVGVSASPVAATICVGNSQALSGTGSFPATTLINTNFSGAPVFTAAGTSSGNRSQIFESEVSGTNVNSAATFTNGSGNIMVSTVGASGTTLGTGSVSTTLTSPVISTTGYTVSTLTFNHTYKQGNTGSPSGRVEISTNGGANWTALTTYTTNQGTSTGFVPVSIDLSAYGNLPSVMIRFNFVSGIINPFSNFYAWWAIDDVVLNATPVTVYSWQASTAPGINGLPANAETPSVSNNNIVVSPTQTTTYTFTAQGQLTGCAVSTATATVTVDQNSTISLTSAPGTDAQVVCIPAALTDITYSVGGGGTGASITSGALPAGVTGSFSAGVFTISGTPTEFGEFSYTITTTGPCINVTASGTITVNTAPTVVCPANDVTNTDPGVCFATRSYEAVGSGFPDPAVSYIVNGDFISFPYDFPLGVTVVEVLAEGACAPNATCSFTVTVNDLEAPAPDLATLPDATGECSVTVTDIPTATDACEGTINGSTTDPLTYNAQGTYTITWSYEDSEGNISTQDQTVVVNDITPPDITCPPAQTFCTIPGNNFTIPSLVANDNCSVISAVTYTIEGATSRTGTGNDASGLFNLGVSTIIWTVTDGNNNSSTCSTTVTINVAPPPPTITGIVNVCPYLGTGDPITYVATSPGATTYNWTLPPNVNVVSGLGTGTLVLTFNTGFSSQPNKQLRVTASNDCGTSSLAIFYLLTQFPVTPSPISGPTNVCTLIGTANSATYTISPVLAATSYVWSTPAGTNVTHPNGPGVNDTIIEVTFDNSFTGGVVSAIAANGCGASGTRTLTVPRTPSSTPGLISGPTNVCSNILPDGSAATYSIIPVNGATSYTWTAPPGSVVTHPNGPGANDISITVQFPAGFSNGTISVSSTNGCGTSGLRSLTVNKLNPATPSVIDVIQVSSCEDPGGRVFTYTLSSMPANATSVQWSVPVGAILMNGQGTTSITVSYPPTAINGNVTAQAVNSCASSTVRKSAVLLPACPPPGFSKNETNSKNGGRVSLVVEQIEAVNVFPNPSVGDFNLRVVSSSDEIIHVRLYDMQGRQISTFKVTAYQTIKFGNDLGTGSYMVEVVQGNNKVVKKILKF